ncbi:MAG: helix-turn-helix transcriptional regulator [Clostridia bacterium]|nr:helix-turn-helix transcriptional regulator [Clostridia bacterium]
MVFLQMNMNKRILTVVVFALQFAWVLAFPFEGQILYALGAYYGLDASSMALSAVTACFAGLFVCGFFIKTALAAKRMMQGFCIYSFLVSFVFFFPPSPLWTAALISSTFLSGACVAAWGFFLKWGTPSNERIKTVADGLIYSNILMTGLNTVAILLAPQWGLGLIIVTLALAFIFISLLPTDWQDAPGVLVDKQGSPASIFRPLAFLCLFVVVITINSGLMYQVLIPAYAHLEWLVSWYWAIPYIVFLYIMRNLSKKTNRTYFLYMAITMIGFSFIAFMLLDRSASSYLAVNTLMLGACGIYDLFWWSILGEMLDLHKNPAKILGIGLSANVFGVLLGGLIGEAITAAESPAVNSSIIALTVVCVTLAILPILHKHLSALLSGHVYLTDFSALTEQEQKQYLDKVINVNSLTGREKEITFLLLQGKTYRIIAEELHVSENTVKTHVKNIYAKLGIQNRTQLASILMLNK